jgi:hypothetical protein
MIHGMLKPVQVAAFGASLFLTAGFASAQIPKDPGPPRPTAPYAAYALTAICLGAVFVAAFKNSKRSHQD